MKKYLSILILIFTISISAIAQERGNYKDEKIEKIKNLKIAYLTSKLNLDQQTAAKFWPIYNQYSDELRSIKKEKRAIMKQSRNNHNATDADAEKMLNSTENLQQQELDINKKYKVEFLKVLTPSQLIVLYKCEREFKEMILKRMQERRGGDNEENYRNRYKNSQYPNN